MSSWDYEPASCVLPDLQAERPERAPSAGVGYHTCVTLYIHPLLFVVTLYKHDTRILLQSSFDCGNSFQVMFGCRFYLSLCRCTIYSRSVQLHVYRISNPDYVSQNLQSDTDFFIKINKSLLALCHNIFETILALCHNNFETYLCILN